jgi:hypothetical protein
MVTGADQLPALASCAIVTELALDHATTVWLPSVAIANWCAEEAGRGYAVTTSGSLELIVAAPANQ